WLLGGGDDVMNVSGHRISTIEVESALVDHQRVAEAAVCGRKDERTGQAIVAYVSLKGGDEGSVEMLEELRNHVALKIGPIAKPANIVFTPELPKTRSGKIMRRLLRDVAEHRELGDTTTLADPTVVEDLLRLDRVPFEHLAAQAEHDQPLRALELEDEAALCEAPRLLELVGRDRLLGDAAQLAHDRRDGLVDPVDVDAGLRVERARVGVAVVHAEDVVGEAAPLAHLAEEARRHPAAEHGREELEGVAVGVLDRVAADA